MLTKCEFDHALLMPIVAPGMSRSFLASAVNDIIIFMVSFAPPSKMPPSSVAE
jgi:hypothetical protein